MVLNVERIETNSIGLKNVLHKDPKLDSKTKYFEKMHEMIDEVEKMIEEVTEVEKLGRIDDKITQIKDAFLPSSILFGKSIQMMLKLADINTRIQDVKQKLDEKAEKILDDQIVKDCKSVKLEYHVDPEISPISDQEKLLYFMSMRPSKVNKP